MSVDDSDEENDIEKTNIFSSTTLKVMVEPDFRVPPCLVLLVGPAELMGKQWVIDKSAVVIGRSADADIQVSEPSLSKNHARIEVINNRVFLTDLGSTNCTFVDSQKLAPQQGVLLKNNHQVRAGSLIFKYLERGILSETSEKARMQSELEKARLVQATLFPSEDETRTEWVKVVGRYRAASECGGDWWWRWSHGDKVYALIGDATGHGAAAALLTSAARSAIGTLEDDPSASIEKVYHTLSRAIGACAAGTLTMSSFIVEVNLRTRVMRYINASHLPAVILPRDREDLTWKTLEHLGGQVSSPLGSTEVIIHVATAIAPIKSRLVLLTDGLTEREDISGKPLSERIFGNMMIQAQLVHQHSASEFLDALLIQSDLLAMQNPIADDITVVALDFD